MKQNPWPRALQFRLPHFSPLSFFEFLIPFLTLSIHSSSCNCFSRNSYLEIITVGYRSAGKIFFRILSSQIVASELNLIFLNIFLATLPLIVLIFLIMTIINDMIINSLALRVTTFLLFLNETAFYTALIFIAPNVVFFLIHSQSSSHSFSLWCCYLRNYLIW